MPFVSNGELLRALPTTHPRYEEIRGYMNRGDLVPQDFIADLLKDRLSQGDCVNGFVMDGWGRKAIDLELYDPNYDVVIFIDISKETSLKRITGRRICTVDNSTCNIYTLPSQTGGSCDKCGGELIQREDDTEEVVLHRLELFEQDTLPVINTFRRAGKLIEVNGEPLPDEILADILQKLKAFNVR